MRTNDYQIVLEHATNEMIEINAQLEKLAQRKDLIEKLVELLKRLVPQSDPADSSAAVLGAPTPEVPVPLAESAAKKTAVSAEGDGHSISNEQVARLAHRFWTERGCLHGHHEEDWLRAEHELRGTAL